MPLFHKEEIANGVSMAIWKIEESLEALSMLYAPSGEEIKSLESTKIESKKLEWLSARLALKALLPNTDYEVVKNEFGKPHLTLQGLEISISHTKGYAAAALSTKKPIGIDIEHERPQILRIAHKFLHESEKAWAGEDITKLTQIWCAKEALYKLHGRTQLIFAEQLKVNPPDTNGTSTGEILEHGESSSFQLHWEKHNEFWSCIVH
ncbi:MAG: phosphopantetheinyl transferase [Roseivirga sp.]|jgi:phosphopantetheinyl transferase